MNRSTRARAARIHVIAWAAAVLIAHSVFVSFGWSADRAVSRLRGFACDDTGTQASYLYLSQQLTYTCALQVGLPVETIHVVLSTTGARSVRFSIPDPPVGTILDESWLLPHTGDRINGLQFDLDGCAQTQTLILGTLLVLPGEAIEGCHDWQIAGAEIEECNGATQFPKTWASTIMGSGCITCACWQCCTLLPARPLSPLDGATNVPLDTALSWVGADVGRIEISSDANCQTSEAFEFVGTNSFVPDFLQPETTYYWQVSFDGTGSGCSNGGGARSRVVSFTTGATVALDVRTWAHVKRLYR